MSIIGDKRSQNTNSHIVAAVRAARNMFKRKSANGWILSRCRLCRGHHRFRCFTLPDMHTHTHTHTNSDDPFDINAFGQTITELFDAHILQTVNPPSAQMHQPQYMHYVYCHQQRSESVCACIELSALCLSTVNAVKFIAHKLLP